MGKLHSLRRAILRDPNKWHSGGRVRHFGYGAYERAEGPCPYNPRLHSVYGARYHWSFKWPHYSSSGGWEPIECSHRYQKFVAKILCVIPR